MGETYANAIVQLLESVRQRPLTYIGSHDPIAVVHFLDGIDAACSAFGYRVSRYPDTIYEQVVKEHGWEFLAARPHREMSERGLTAETIVYELLTIEIETWKQTYHLP